MKGISASGKKVIERSLDKLFDGAAYGLLGPFGRGKSILFTSKSPNLTLAHLFVQAMRNREPNLSERDLLKGLLGTSLNYITALRDRTKASVIDRLDGAIRTGTGKLTTNEFKKIVREEMEKSRKHLQMIAESETTKVRNHGAAMDILKVGESIGAKDPVCYFVVVHDDKTCKYCIKNHLRDDELTPKVFRFSEIKHSYLSTVERKAGDVSTHGQHPHCRCTLVMLSPGFGFKDGRVTYIGMGHDELASQRSADQQGAQP
jgi:hypothetical protein